MKFQVDQEEDSDTLSQTSLFSVPQDSPFQGESIMIALIVQLNDERFLQSFLKCEFIFCSCLWDFQEWLEAKPSEGMNILYTGQLAKNVMFI